MNFPELLKKYREALGMTQEQLAVTCGFGGQSRIGNYERGTREPKIEDLQVLSTVLGVSISGLLGDDLSSFIDDGWTDIASMNAAAGPPPVTVDDDYPMGHKLKFKNESFREKRLKADHLAVIYANDQSMAPAIEHGDAVLYDRSDIQPKDGKIYIVTFEDMLWPRRLMELDGAWYAKSDNAWDPRWPKPRRLDPERGLNIAGRVRWVAGWID